MNQKEKHNQQLNCLYCLIAAHALDKAILRGKLAKSTTLEEAQGTARLISLLFDENVNPYEFMRPIDENANKSIEEYKVYKKMVSEYPGNLRVIESFSKWYVNNGFEIALLKCNIMYIITLGSAISANRFGTINRDELIEHTEQYINKANKIFSYHPNSIKRCFLQAVLKYDEISTKVNKREMGMPEKIEKFQKSKSVERVSYKKTTSYLRIV